MWPTGRKHCQNMAISDVTTVSEEGFVILVLENYWESGQLKVWRNTKQSKVAYDETTDQKKKESNIR